MNTSLIRLKADTENTPYVYRDNTQNDMAMIAYLPDAPVIEGELNYQQQLTAMHLRRMVRTIIGRSTLLTPISPSATGLPNEIRLHTEDTMFHAAVNGIVKTVYAYDNPVSGSKTEGGNRVILPDYLSAGRKDLVYLEIWFEEVMNPTAEGTADTTVYRYGMVHGFTDTNNIKVTSYGELKETTRRVQLRGQIKSVAGTESLIGVYAKNSTTYSYSDVGGYLRSGTGDVTSATNLNSVDGYTYAIPLVVVTRGATSSVMSDVQVVAPSTATLQQLASSTLKDVAQFGADIAALYTSTSSSANRLTQLESENVSIKQANATLTANLDTANKRIDAANKLLKVKKQIYAPQLVDFEYSKALLTKPTSLTLSQELFYLPANYRLSVGRVFVNFPSENTNFWFLIYNPNNRVTKSWRWQQSLTTPRGGTYAGYLLRDGDANIIDVPDFDSTRDEYLLVYSYIQHNTTGSALNIQSGITVSANVELIMTPK